MYKKSIKLIATAIMTIVTAVAVLPANMVSAANPQLVVDLATTIKANADHAASGALYAFRNDARPDDQAIIPLRPKMIAQPSPNPGMIPNRPYEVGPVGDAIKVADKAKRLGIQQIQIYMSDCYPDFPQKWVSWDDYYVKLDAQVDAVKSSKYPQGYFTYIPWNEPDWTWNNPYNTGVDFNTGYKRMYDRIKAKDTVNKIEGPNIAVYTHDYMLSFLTFAKANNCVPDIISFHTLDNNTIQSFESEIDDCRAIMRSLGISDRPISINEYIAASELGKPGIAVRYMAKFERKLVDSAATPFWFRCGTFGDTLTGETNIPNGAWWLYKFYGDMLGKMVKVTAPSGSVLDGMASVDTASQQVKLVFGGAAGNNDIVLQNVSTGAPFITGSAHVVMYKTTNSGGTGTQMVNPTYVYQGEYAVTNNTITIPMLSMTDQEAYELIITPSTPGAAYTANRYEAEYAQFDGTANVDRDHTGYSGTGFVGGYDYSTNANTRFVVGVADDGVFSANLRYSAGPHTDGANRIVGLYVNSVKVKDLTLNGTANWDTWANSSTNVFLEKGVNIIEYKAEKTDNSDCINLDYIDVTSTSASVYEAENAARSGTAVVATNHAGYYGSGFVAGYDFSTTAATTFTVNAAAAGSYNVAIRYSAGEQYLEGWPVDRVVGLYLNDVKVSDLTLKGTVTWNEWDTSIQTMNLNAGNNTIAIKAERTDNSDCINLDRITVFAKP